MGNSRDMQKPDCRSTRLPPRRIGAGALFSAPGSEQRPPQKAFLDPAQHLLLAQLVRDVEGSELPAFAEQVQPQARPAQRGQVRLNGPAAVILSGQNIDRTWMQTVLAGSTPLVS